MLSREGRSYRITGKDSSGAVPFTSNGKTIFQLEAAGRRECHYRADPDWLDDLDRLAQVFFRVIRARKAVAQILVHIVAEGRSDTRTRRYSRWISYGGVRRLKRQLTEGSDPDHRLGAE